MNDGLAWQEVFRSLFEQGTTITARGRECLEWENAQFTVPRDPFMWFEGRRINLDYVRREFQWYLRAQLDDLSIAKYAALWRQHINADNTLSSNYGHYLFATPGGLMQAVLELANDRESRRACVTILDTSKHAASETQRDVPCTYAISWRVRNGQLNQTVRMRSNDLWFGLGNDAPIFHWIHCIAWLLLRETYHELELGDYVHCADSLHIYKEQIARSLAVAEGRDMYIPREVPRLDNHDAAWDLVHYPATKHTEFTRWLYEVTL